MKIFKTRFLPALLCLAMLFGAATGLAVPAAAAAPPAGSFAPETLGLTPGAVTGTLNFNWYSDASLTGAPMLEIRKTGGTTELGVDLLQGAASAGKNYNKATAKNLAADTEYVYRVSSDSGATWSGVYTYKTPAAESFSFAVTGDPQLTVGNQDATSNYLPGGALGTTKQGWQDTLDAIEAKGVDFIAGVGDQVDTTSNGSEAEYDNFFAPAAMNNIPYAPAVGNNDRHYPFKYHYNLPNELDPVPVVHGGNSSNVQYQEMEVAGNYFYLYNNALFVVLNDSGYPSDTDEAGEYIEIFDETLSAAIAEHDGCYNWLFVQHHKSTQSVADHCADRDIQYYVEAGFEELMDKHGVDFVLAGHDHVYARSYPMKGGVPDKTGADDGAPANTLTQGGDGADGAVNPDGTIYFTTTTASGLKYYELFNNAGNLYVKDNTEYPYLVEGLFGSAAYAGANITNVAGNSPSHDVGKLPLSAAKYLQDKAPGYMYVEVGADEVTFNYYDLENYSATPYDTYTVTKKASDIKNITIFHTNDLHGSVAGALPATVSQLAKISELKKSEPGSILADAGDATQGNSFATLTKGADVIDLMSLAGYDVMAAGNHEFDYGLEQLISNAQRASFPILSANAVKDGEPVLKGLKYAGGANTNNGARHIIETDGVKIGFFGITTPETATKTNPEGIAGVTFSATVSEITTISEEQITALKAEGAEIIVGLMHLGIDESSAVTGRAVAAAFKDGCKPDVIIDGHSHSVVNETVNGICLAQSGYGGNNVGKIEIEYDAPFEDILNVDVTLIALSGLADFDQAVEDKAKELLAAQQALLAPVVGKTATTLWGGTVNGLNEARLYETNLGSLIADSMLDAAKTAVAGNPAYDGMPVVALQNGGGVRAVINAGDITKGDVINVLPFGNSLAYKLVTPKTLFEALENAVGKIVSQDPATGKITGADGRFPQIAGMRFEFNPESAATEYDGSNNPTVYGDRVTKIVLLNADGTDGAELSRNDSATQIILASNDFEIAGGDGYIMLKGLPSVGEGGVLDEVFAGYLTKITPAGGAFNYPNTMGRVKTVGAYVPSNYTAYVTLKNDAGEEWVSKVIMYKVDGSASRGSTGPDGILAIADLPDGPHIITFANAPDILVNNYSGAGLAGGTEVVVTSSEPSFAEPPTDRPGGNFTGSAGAGTPLAPAATGPIDDTSVSGDKGADTAAPGKGDGTSAGAGGRQDEWSNPFSDVRPSDWFYDDVAYACSNGLFVGTSNDSFSPDAPMSRAMLATVIWRMEGSPAAGAGNPFADVADGEWYTEAVAWAAANGIVKGVGDNRFVPDEDITRQDMATIIWRYMDMGGWSISAVRQYDTFSDEGDIADYAIQAVTELYSCGIINGKPNNLFDPNGLSTRAETAAILHRLLTA